MKTRTFQIGASFAIVLVAYWCYALLALPWIETPLKPIPNDHDTVIIKPPPPPREYDELAVLFPSDAWELHDRKIISSNDQILLLWKTYANKADNWVELNPLTVVYVPDDTTTDRTERFRHAIVMEVPGGAHLRFDRPLDLKHGTGIGRLIDGRLLGQVTIRSRGRRPDHQDDLFARTHDVELTEQRITTPNQVEFTYGASSGRGRQLEIKLLPRLGARVANREGPDIGGIEEIRLEHVERLHMEMGTSDKYARLSGLTETGDRARAPGVPGPSDAKLGQAGKPDVQSGPVEIACRGPFRFQLVDQVATFRDQVEVLRMHMDGPSDHLNCDVLAVYFTRPPHVESDAEKSKPHGPNFDLQPERIEARGSPAVLTAPIDHLQATAGTLQCNLLDGQIYLHDRQEVVLQKDRDEIHTPSLHYVPGPAGHEKTMFQLVAGGPGWLRAEMAGAQTAGNGAPSSQQQFEARWQAKLEVRPQEQKQVISLTGGAALRLQAMGQLEAREIHFRLSEVPAAGGEPTFQPDQLFALDKVTGDSPQFSCHAEERFDVWFTNAASASGSGRAPLLDNSGRLANRVPNDYKAAGGSPPVVAANLSPPNVARPASQPPLDSSARPAPDTFAPYVPSTAVAPAPSLVPRAPNPAAERQDHMDISGRLLQARVVLHDRQQGDLTEVTVIDHVKLRQTQTAEPDAKPLLVTGDWLKAIDANAPQAKVIIQGKPAHMEGRGMSLTGPNIAIDRGANRLVMEGAGEMEMLVDRDLENRPLQQPSIVHTYWQKNMVFDGRKAHFQDDVKVRGETQLLETGWMDVCFQHAISFSDVRQQQQPLVETIHCGDGVYVVNQTFDAGQQVSSDRLQLKGLDMNNLTGEFHADGPGRVISVRRGGGQGFAMPSGGLAAVDPASGGASVRPAAFAPTQPQADPKQMTCLDLRFMKSITGNKNRKELVFHGQVHAAHAAAQSWATTLEDDDPARLPKAPGLQPVVLHSESLEIADMSPVGGGGGSMEFQARDNVVVEGTNLFARCARMSYSQSKDQLIFEGDGRSDAELYKQEAQGLEATPFKAQKIVYYQKTGQVNVDGFRSLQMNQLPEKAPGSAGR